MCPRKQSLHYREVKMDIIHVNEPLFHKQGDNRAIAYESHVNDWVKIGHDSKRADFLSMQVIPHRHNRRSSILCAYTERAAILEDRSGLNQNRFQRSDILALQQTESSSTDIPVQGDVVSGHVEFFTHPVAEVVCVLPLHIIKVHTKQIQQPLLCLSVTHDFAIL
nr:MAG TPA: hypothetical protein [Herelleviridae sp.]